jgi:hypothetical protein
MSSMLRSGGEACVGAAAAKLGESGGGEGAVADAPVGAPMSAGAAAAAGSAAGGELGDGCPPPQAANDDIPKKTALAAMLRYVQACMSRL